MRAKNLMTTSTASTDLVLQTKKAAAWANDNEVPVVVETATEKQKVGDSSPAEHLDKGAGSKSKLTVEDILDLDSLDDKCPKSTTIVDWHRAGDLQSLSGSINLGS